MTDARPSIDEMWALLQEQRAEIAQLKEQLEATRGNGDSSSDGNGNTPIGIERRLSRAGLLKAAAAGVAGLAVTEASGTMGAQPAGAASGLLEYHNYVASDGNVPARPEIAFRTEATAYDYGVYVIGNISGVVGRGTRVPASGNNIGVAGQSCTDATGKTFGSGMGVLGESGTGIGVKGVTYNTRRLTPSIELGGTGVLGESKGGSGVTGHSLGKPGIGVLGFDTSNTGTGVAGVSFADSSQRTLGAGTGVLGRGKVGVKGESNANDGYGVHGSNKGFLGTAIYGESLTPQGGPGHGYGVYGHTGDGFAVYGRSVDNTGRNPGAGVGVKGESGSDAGVAGESVSGAGVFGITTGNTGSGVNGRSYTTPGRGALGNGNGVLGESGSGAGAKGTSQSGPGVQGTSQSGPGVQGVSGGSPGVAAANALAQSVQAGVYGSGKAMGIWGTGDPGPGVQGEAAKHVGVFGISSGHYLTGVYGIQTTNDGTGVAGRSYADSGQGALGGGTGVFGESGSGAGVWGNSQSGRGGKFAGGAAQLQLTPSPAASPPTTGQTGDLFLDASAKLWLCTAGATNGTPAVWQNLGAGGGTGGNGPLAIVSHAAATPAVAGTNDSNDAKSTGLSGQSLDGSGNPGNGSGVQGSSGTGAGVVGASYLDATHTRGGLGDGVRGTSGMGNAVYGLCEQGIGVRAETNGDGAPALYARNGSLGGGTGMQSLSVTGIAVDAQSTDGTAVNAFSTSGRAGVFWSAGPAQLQLLPGGPKHPDTGKMGDFYLDSSGALWFCTKSDDATGWKQLA